MTKRTGKDDKDLEETPDGFRGGKRTIKEIIADQEPARCRECGKASGGGRYCYACGHYKLNLF